MESYGARDVEKLLRLSRATLNALIKAGFVTPTRGPRQRLEFSFQDLIVLRTAQALLDARVPKRRILQSLRELRRRLPASMPLSGLRIRAVGDRVVVSEREGRWQADSGQYLLAFESDPATGALGVVEPAATVAAETPEPDDWYEQAIALEREDPAAAQAAYERAIAAEPQRLEPYINLGRLLHESGRLGQAERVYRKALGATRADALLQYNLAVLLEDMGRAEDAVRAYQSALRSDPELADGHHNLALLFEASGRTADAIRHMAQYRRLMRSR
jgi:tetratricopeptide (TPR) repeat protein